MCPKKAKYVVSFVLRPKNASDSILRWFLRLNSKKSSLSAMRPFKGWEPPRSLSGPPGPKSKKSEKNKSPGS